MLGHDLHRVLLGSLQLTLGVDRPGARQRDGGGHGGRPGAQVLDGVLLADELLERHVEVARVQLVPAVRVAVGEEALARIATSLERQHDPREQLVGHDRLARHPRLGGELERHVLTAHGDVRAQQGRDAVRAVLGLVLLPAAAEEAGVEHAQPRRRHPLARQTVGAQVGRHLLARGRELAGQHAHPVVLLAAPRLVPGVVVEVLASTGVVGADGLDVPVRVRADPDVLPGRRDDEGGDALPRLRVDPLPVGVDVAEATCRDGRVGCRTCRERCAEVSHGGITPWGCPTNRPVARSVRGFLVRAHPGDLGGRVGGLPRGGLRVGPVWARDRHEVGHLDVGLTRRRGRVGGDGREDRAVALEVGFVRGHVCHRLSPRAVGVQVGVQVGVAGPPTIPTAPADEPVSVPSATLEPPARRAGSRRATVPTRRDIGWALSHLRVGRLLSVVSAEDADPALLAGGPARAVVGALHRVEAAGVEGRPGAAAVGRDVRTGGSDREDRGAGVGHPRRPRPVAGGVRARLGPRAAAVRGPRRVVDGAGRASRSRHRR